MSTSNIKLKNKAVELLEAFKVLAEFISEQKKERKTFHIQGEGGKHEEQKT
jgi:hypothetical protein